MPARALRSRLMDRTLHRRRLDSASLGEGFRDRRKPAWRPAALSVNAGDRRARSWLARPSVDQVALRDPFGRSQLQVTVRLESDASIVASASRSAGFTDRPYFCLTATT